MERSLELRPKKERRAFRLLKPIAEGLAVLVAAGFIAGKAVDCGPHPPPAAGCDQSLWDHVYIPPRLHVIESCAEVKGTIQEVKVEADGDFHIQLKPDPEYAYLMNPRNISQQGGALVVEPVCMNPLDKWYARHACEGFRQDIVVPPVGTHVTVKGSYVLDILHWWKEIHPVTSIVPDR